MWLKNCPPPIYKTSFHCLCVCSCMANCHICVFDPFWGLEINAPFHWAKTGEGFIRGIVIFLHDNRLVNAMCVCDFCTFIDYLMDKTWEKQWSKLQYYDTSVLTTAIVFTGLSILIIARQGGELMHTCVTLRYYYIDSPYDIRWCLQFNQHSEMIRLWPRPARWVWQIMAFIDCTTCTSIRQD